jgi:hypothetical protein
MSVQTYFQPINALGIYTLVLTCKEIGLLNVQAAHFGRRCYLLTYHFTRSASIVSESDDAGRRQHVAEVTVGKHEWEIRNIIGKEVVNGSVHHLWNGLPRRCLNVNTGRR